MDILAARKKAAEKARLQQKPEQPLEPQKFVAEDAPQGKATRPPAAENAPESQATETASATAPVADTVSAENADQPIETPAKEIEMLSFRLGNEEYALMVDSVREVQRCSQMTIVPNAPDYILGVISLRGAMLPVIDLCKRLGVAHGSRDEKSRIIVVAPDEEDVGLIVDRVTGVHRIMEDAIKPAPENIEHGREFLRGIIRKDDKLYIVLDLMKAVERESA